MALRQIDRKNVLDPARIGGCDVGILVFIASQVIFSISPVSGPYTMINEAGMLLCFGVAWLVKGETIFKDKPGN